MDLTHLEIPANAKRLRDYNDGLDKTDSADSASQFSNKANSYLANFLTSSLLSSVSFTQPPPDTTTHKQPLNLQTMSVNFRSFVQKTGPLFSILDSVEAVLLWRSTPVTVLAVLVWTVLCLYPALVLVAPQFVVLCILLHNHGIRFSKDGRDGRDSKGVDNNTASTTTDATPTTAPTSPSSPTSPLTPSQPPPEPNLPDSSSPDYYLNLQSIQNLMGTTNDGIDGCMPYYRKLNWSDVEQSRGVLKYTVISLLCTCAVLPILPLRLIVAISGYSVLAVNHPVIKEYL
ncbi:hypothetical protein E3P99_02804 [Wallemia hederae]|uniref:TECPR1-like DysF domain-containing protein n=1 Tax=Wallemia hederae TaxID=1540922 RepID=A0A4T0FIT1_9BASI|nr:hypothetical protein E3P99_02804 [Wallemia hederae]